MLGKPYILSFNLNSFNKFHKVCIQMYDPLFMKGFEIRPIFLLINRSEGRSCHNVHIVQIYTKFGGSKLANCLCETFIMF